VHIYNATCKLSSAFLIVACSSANIKVTIAILLALCLLRHVVVTLSTQTLKRFLSWVLTLFYGAITFLFTRFNLHHCLYIRTLDTSSDTWHVTHWWLPFLSITIHRQVLNTLPKAVIQSTCQDAEFHMFYQLMQSEYKTCLQKAMPIFCVWFNYPIVSCIRD
jgi:phosphotransferase system  glucose/maltose/N-acetylglucosamine-specific IIC component